MHIVEHYSRLRPSFLFDPSVQTVLWFCVSFWVILKIMNSSILRWGYTAFYWLFSTEVSATLVDGAVCKSSLFFFTVQVWRFSLKILFHYQIWGFAVNVIPPPPVGQNFRLEAVIVGSVSRIGALWVFILFIYFCQVLCSGCGLQIKNSEDGRVELKGLTKH